MGKRPPLHLGVVAIEKGALGSPSTKVTNSLYMEPCRFGFFGGGDYGISSIVGHLMPNPFHKYSKFMISKHILQIKFLNKLEFALFLHTVKWFHLISNN